MDYPDFESVEGGDFMEKLQDAFTTVTAARVIVITRSNKRANRYNEGFAVYILSAEEEIESGDMLMVVKNNYHYAAADAQGSDELHRQRRHRPVCPPASLRGFLRISFRRL